MIKQSKYIVEFSLLLILQIKVNYYMEKIESNCSLYIH